MNSIRSKSKTKTKKNKEGITSKTKKNSFSKSKSKQKKISIEKPKRSSKKLIHLHQQSASQLRDERRRDSLLSPKTISYKKIMEKYGNLDSENESRESVENVKDDHFQSETKFKKSSNYYYDERAKNEFNFDSNSLLSKTQSIQNHHYIDEIKYKQLLNENEKLREDKKNYEKLKIKISQLEEKLSSGNIVNYEEIVKLKEKIENVEKINESLKNSKEDYINQTQKKLIMFIKLCQKYLNKIINITNIQSKFNTNSDSKDIIFGELKSVIDKFSINLSNQNLMNSIFDKLNLRDDYLDNEDSFSKNNNSSLIEVIQKLENQVKSLTEKNENLNKSKKLDVDGIEELKRIRKNYNEIKFNFEEGQKTILIQKEMIKELESKVRMLDNENQKCSNKIIRMKDKNNKYNLIKEKLIKYKNELTYKQSIIEYLEKSSKTGKIGINLIYKDYDYSGKNQRKSSRQKNQNIPLDEGFNKSQTDKYVRTDENLEMEINNDEDNMNNREENEENYKENRDSKRETGSRRELKRDSLKDAYNDKISPIKENRDGKMNSEENGENDYQYVKLKNEENNYEENENIHETSFKNNFTNQKYLETEHENENREIYTISETNNSKSIILKKEINNLDQEIRNLQGKLRSMIDVNK